MIDVKGKATTHSKLWPIGGRDFVLVTRLDVQHCPCDDVNDDITHYRSGISCGCEITSIALGFTELGNHGEMSDLDDLK